MLIEKSPVIKEQSQSNGNNKPLTLMMNHTLYVECGCILLLYHMVFRGRMLSDHVWKIGVQSVQFSDFLVIDQITNYNEVNNKDCNNKKKGCKCIWLERRAQKIWLLKMMIMLSNLRIYWKKTFELMNLYLLWLNTTYTFL